jgi:hypothetical protein
MEYTKNIKVGDTVMFTSTSMQEACRASSLSLTLYKDLIKHPYGVVCAKGRDYFLVEFEGIHTGHDGNGITRPRKGVYICPDNLVVEHNNDLIVSLSKLL